LRQDRHWRGSWHWQGRWHWHDTGRGAGTGTITGRGAGAGIQHGQGRRRTGRGQGQRPGLVDSGGRGVGRKGHMPTRGAAGCPPTPHVLAEIAAMETGRRFMAASLRRGADQGEPSLEAGVELAERGARRAVMDFWGRLHGFAQLGVPKRGLDSVGRYHPILRVTETGLRCAGPSFEAEPPA
jgi:hypothetical protein